MSNESQYSALKNWTSYLTREFKKELKWSKKNQAKTLKTLLSLVKENIYLSDASSLLMQYGNKKEKVIGKKISHYLDSGFSIDSAMKEDLSLQAYQSLRAGVKSDNVQVGLKNAISTLELNDSMGWPLLWHFIKPSFGLFVSCAFTTAFSSEIYPTITKTIDEKLLPSLSRFMNEVGIFFSEHGLFLSLILTIIFTLIISTLPLLTGGIREKLDPLPIYKQYRLLISSSLLDSLSNLSHSGIDLNDAIDEIKTNANPYLKSHLDTMSKNIEIGHSNIGEIINSGLLLDEQSQVIKILGKTSNISSILSSSASIHRTALVSTIDRVKKYGQNIVKGLGYTILISTFLAIILSVLSIQSNIQHM